MAIIKCKMCGGDLDIIEGVSVAECEYCGTKQTVPNADDEKKLTLFMRANRLRFANEFDKAAGVYESIVADFPEEAEAYWGLVLCRYGIEYVDDPAIGNKIPTCHRSSFESVMEDPDFEQACENADGVARRQYREEAKQIEEIRRGIIEVSGKEEPYDIFICYKETDENGDRTIDSVIAQDVYDALTEKGYRVFFSRISLADKLGTEYEPYIFAALNSAKVMLAFGTDFEHFNAVWVKNEWSRFLKLMAADKSKHIIPCYKGIDAYDMPKEFAKLQAQDMGTVGAMQDLLRGIEKLLPRNGAETQPQAAQQIVQGGGPSVDALLKRGNMALGDGEWDKAKECFDQALNINPEQAESYLGIVLSDLRLNNTNDVGLIDRLEDYHFFMKHLSYKRFAQFASPTLKRDVEAFVEQAKSNINQRINDLATVREKLFGFRKLICSGMKHTVGLFCDGTVVAVGDNSFGQCDVSDWQSIVAVSAGDGHTLGLRADGTVVAVGHNNMGQCNVSNWQNIVAISAGGWHTLGLRADGTVVAVGHNDMGQCDVSSWHDMVDIAAGYNSIGLHSDGTVGKSKWRNIIAVSTYGWNAAILLNDGTVFVDEDQLQNDVSKWSDIVAVSMGLNYVVGICSDGTVVATGDSRFGQCNVTDWKLFNNMDTVEFERAEALSRAERERVESEGRAEQERRKAAECAEHIKPLLPRLSCMIAAGDHHTVGLRSDGTVVAAGRNTTGQCNVEGWKNIVAIAAEDDHTVGLRSDGIVVAAGRNTTGQCNVEGWKNIVAIAVGDYHTVGLRADGTVVATGGNFSGQGSVEGWKNIVAIVARNHHTVGLCADGTVVATGSNFEGQCNVEGWKNIVAIAAGDYHTVGLRVDGTVVATGKHDSFQCNVEGWRLFEHLDEIDALDKRAEREQAEAALHAERERQARIAKLETKRASLRAERQARIAKLEEEEATLTSELANIKGLFTGKRKREISDRLAEIESELKKL